MTWRRALAVTGPGTVPARVTAGAGQVRLGGQQRSGVAAGTVLAQPGWAAAASRVGVDAASGASRITVDGGAGEPGG